MRQLMESTPFDVEMQWEIKIPLRDGVRLSATLYLPQHLSGPVPAICSITPYARQLHHDQGIYFAARGYPFLTVDVRGRGDSEGEFHPLNDARQDACDVVEWTAREPWCSGKVAMWGGSYGGYLQWIAAKELPPHLVSIVPVASPYRGVDGPMRNNIFSLYRIQWLTLLAGRALQDKIFADRAFWNDRFCRWLESGAPFAELDVFVGCPSTIFREWLSHPERDEYWDSYNPSAEQYSQISIPILTITGVYDGNQLGALTHYREHMRRASAEGRARHYLVIGPWDHAGTRTPQAEFSGVKCGPESLVDLGRLHLEWYAWTMRGGARPAFLEKQVAYYVMGAEKWRYAHSLEAITDRSVPHYLESSGNPTDVFQSGTLAIEPPGKGGPDRYVYDPRDVGLARLESTLDPANVLDQRMVHARIGRHLVYHGAPFEQATEISGFFKLIVWLAIDQPDTDFQVTVYEIGLDGSATLLTQDVLRARYRESLREAKLIGTCEPLRYEFEHFPFVSRQLKKGHRLRLVVGPIDSIHSQRNYNSGGTVSSESVKDARVVTVKLFHDATHPSALYVPYGTTEDSP